MASTKCRFCNNMTLDPSGRCHLHKHGRFEGKDDGRAKLSSQVASPPSASSNDRIPQAPEYMHESLKEYIDLNDQYVKLDAVREDLINRMRRLPSQTYEFEDGTSFRSSDYNVMSKSKARAFLKDMDAEDLEDIQYSKLSGVDLKMNHPELYEQAYKTSDDMTLYVGGITADYTDVYNEPHPEHDGLSPQELYSKWDDIDYQADEVDHRRDMVAEELKEDFEHGDAYRFNNGVIRARYNGRADLKEAELLAKEQGIDISDCYYEEISTPKFRKAFPEQAARFTRNHGGKFTPKVRNKVYERD